MKWTYSIKNKLTASGILFTLCLLVLISNYIDRNHTKDVKNAISTLYEDRLIAEEYILKMTSGVYEVKEVINFDTNSASKTTRINKLLSKINKTSNAYLKTKFTDAEKIKADELWVVLRNLETIPIDNTSQKLATANKALIILNKLSAIQLDESKKIMTRAEALYQSGKTSSEFVFGIIIILLFALQALVFASKTLFPNTKIRGSQLN
jgi:hypothetical protein